jgi:hypothetical protein
MGYRWVIVWLSEGELLLPEVPLILGRISELHAGLKFRGFADIPVVTRKAPAGSRGNGATLGKPPC